MTTRATMESAASNAGTLLTFAPLSRLEQARELVSAIQRLSLARSIAEIQEIVRSAARRLTGADGATFVLREGEHWTRSLRCGKASASRSRPASAAGRC